MNYPTVHTILNARRRELEMDYSEAEAARLRPVDPTFIPTNNEQLNRIREGIGVTVLVDVPRQEDHTYETFPYTNNRTGIIHLPHPDAFSSPDMYTHTLAHELGHLTLKAMGRPGGMGYTTYEAWFTDKYNNEELVAELTAMGLEMATTGKLAAEEQSLSYLQSFLKRSQEGKSAEERWEWAVAEADKAVNYLLGFLKD